MNISANDIKYMVLQELGRMETPDFVASDENDVKLVNQRYEYYYALALQYYNWNFCKFAIKLDEPVDLHPEVVEDDNIDSSNGESGENEITTQQEPLNEEEYVCKYKYKYTLPDKVLFIRGRYSDETLSNEVNDYEQIENYLYCDEPELYISFTGKVGETELPATFIDFLKFFIASEICNTLTGDLNLLQYLINKKESSFKQAKNTDVRQGTIKVINTLPYIEVRY